MGLVGRLEDLGLPDIFQIISLTKKTGKLTLTRREGTGVIVFKDGQIIYASSDSIRETLGNILVCQKLITEATLLAALEVQHRSPTGKRLGAILVEKGYLTKETLEKVIKQQIEKVVCEFITWKSGFFKFDVLSLRNGDEVEVDAKDFLIKTGLNPEYLVLEGIRKMDEQQEREREQKKNAQSQRVTVSAAAAQDEAGAQKRRTLTTLKAVLSGLRSPSFTAEITLTLMRYAAEIVSRGILFALTRDGIIGMGQFGIELNGGSADDQVRKIKIPHDQPSILAQVSETRQTYRGKLQKTFWNDYLVTQLGGSVPQEVLAVPMIVNGAVVVIFYGDNVPTNRPIGEIEGLELFMIQAGLAMEKSLLERKIEAFEQRNPEGGSLKR
jgi:hypothetical protein